MDPTKVFDGLVGLEDIGAEGDINGGQLGTSSEDLVQQAVTNLWRV